MELHSSRHLQQGQYQPSAQAVPLVLQEDAHTTVLDVSDSGKESGVGLFGVFDGHGGKAVAKFVAKHVVRSPYFSATYSACCGLMTITLGDAYSQGVEC